MRAIVIHSNQDYASDSTPFPPIGATGEIVEWFDKYDECEIVFDDYAMPIPSEAGWTTHRSMIVLVGGELSDFKQTEASVYAP